MKPWTLFCLLLVVGLLYVAEARYDPTWESLDQRPLPTWFDDSKLGIFIHWGVFSVIGYHSEWYDVAWVWYAWKGSKDADVVKFFADNYPPDITYADFAEQFHATFYEPNQWADVFSKSGAKYIVLTSKHHEGYTMWPSNYSWNWNAMDVGPHRDLVGDLAKAIRSKTNLHFGLYHSMFEWFHPLYLQDKVNGWNTRSFPEKKALPELYEIVNSYLPDVIWSDGDWEAPDTYWNSTGFIAWLYNDSPVKNSVVTNDRWGAGVMCKHGGYFTCSDKYNPGVLQPRKWENCMTLDNDSWGYRRNLNAWDVLSIEQLIGTLAATVSCGGNLLVNVGPTGDGTIPPIFQERLLQLGAWMQINGDAIYSTKPWSHQNDTFNPNVWYTSKAAADGSVDVYAIVLLWDSNATLTLGAPKPSDKTEITILGTSTPLKWAISNNQLVIRLPALQTIPAPQEWAYVVKLSHLTNRPHAKKIMQLPKRFRKNSIIRKVR
jgi:alpha-L-fucosidase